LSDSVKIAAVIVVSDIFFKIEDGVVDLKSLKNKNKTNVTAGKKLIS